MRKSIKDTAAHEVGSNAAGRPPEQLRLSPAEAAVFPELSELGERLNRMRKERGLTLDDVAKITSIGRSTLSKIENGQMSPTYDLLARLAAGMKIDLATLFNSPQLPRGTARSITRRGQGSLSITGTYRHELLAEDLTRKSMLTFKTIVTARSLDQFSDWSRHRGEEFLVVLAGVVEVHTEVYAPVRLETGDSIYFDGDMGHAVLSVSEQDAEVIWVSIDGPSMPFQS
jgi:transcriptional regulator with XRE-family HTH domain